MATERQHDEAVARFVAVMVLYHNEPRSRASRASMRAEVRTASALALALGLDTRAVARAVEPELIARYGPETVRSLYRAFLSAFGAPAPSPSGHVIGPLRV